MAQPLCGLDYLCSICVDGDFLDQNTCVVRQRRGLVCSMSEERDRRREKHQESEREGKEKYRDR